MKNKYRIRYQHTSAQEAGSKRAALMAVRAMMGQRRVFAVSVPDGTYCYRTPADRTQDDSGARAYAVICSPAQQPE